MQANVQPQPNGVAKDKTLLSALGEELGLIANGVAKGLISIVVPLPSSKASNGKTAESEYVLMHVCPGCGGLHRAKTA